MCSLRRGTSGGIHLIVLVFFRLMSVVKVMDSEDPCEQNRFMLEYKKVSLHFYFILFLFRKKKQKKMKNNYPLTSFPYSFSEKSENYI